MMTKFHHRREPGIRERSDSCHYRGTQRRSRGASAFPCGAAYPSGYLRVEWWNANEGTPAESGRPISDVEISGGVHLHRQHVLFSHLQSRVDSHQSRQTNRVTPGRTRSCVPWQLSCEQAVTLPHPSIRGWNTARSSGCELARPGEGRGASPGVVTRHA